MTTSEAFAAVAEHLLPGARLRAVRRLTGGVSADVHALDLEDMDGHRRTVVVRRHGVVAGKSRHGAEAAMEYGLLQALHRAGLAVPEPLLLDTTGRVLPGSYLVMEFVDGSTDLPTDALDPYLDVMAATLSRLHALALEDLPELPLRVDPLPEVLDFLPDAAEWRALRSCLADCADTAYRDTPVLLHGDFWPGNLLWRDGRLVAILDWEDAAMGDPAVDVAGCRLELLWKFGPAAMERFTQSYRREQPLDLRRLALWEVYVATAGARFMSGWGLDPGREADMRTKAYRLAREAGRVLMSRAGPGER